LAITGKLRELLWPNCFQLQPSAFTNVHAETNSNRHQCNRRVVEKVLRIAAVVADDHRCDVSTTIIGQMLFALFACVSVSLPIMLACGSVLIPWFRTIFLLSVVAPSEDASGSFMSFMYPCYWTRIFGRPLIWLLLSFLLLLYRFAVVSFTEALLLLTQRFISGSHVVLRVKNFGQERFAFARFLVASGARARNS